MLGGFAYKDHTMSINIEASEATSVDLNAVDRALVAGRTHEVLTCVTVVTTNSAKMELKDGSGGTVKYALPSTSTAGLVVNFENGLKFEKGIYVDAGGSATGLITIGHWGYVKGV